VIKWKTGSCAALRARSAARLVGFARVPSLDRNHKAPAPGGACARCPGEAIAFLCVPLLYILRQDPGAGGPPPARMTLDLHGITWNCMELYGFVWISIDLDGFGSGFPAGPKVIKWKTGSCAALRARSGAKLVGTARVPSPDRKHPAPAPGGACARCPGWQGH